MLENLEQLASDLLSFYQITPKNITVVQGNGIKTVWKVNDTQGNLTCLKRLRQNKEKALFSVSAQKYMHDKNAKVPGVYPTRDHQYLVEYKGQIFVLYQWLEGKYLSLNVKEHLAKALGGLASFHLDSAGYEPPPDCRLSTKLGKWPHHYQSIAKRFAVWTEQAAKNTQDQTARVFLENVDFFADLAQKASELLDHSFYQDWVLQLLATQKILCHQDYGEGNALWNERGVYVIDLDGVTFDLPVRDLRKIIFKVMGSRGQWDPQLLQNILMWYEQVNPLTEAQRRVVWIDLLFPHQFHDTAKNPFHKHKPISPSKLLKVCQCERSKIDILTKLL